MAVKPLSVLGSIAEEANALNMTVADSGDDEEEVRWSGFRVVHVRDGDICSSPIMDIMSFVIIIIIIIVSLTRLMRRG